MDVVKRSVEALNGAIVLESAPGAGTTIRLHLPLTLAVADGLLLRIGAQSFALPFSAVVESLRPKPGQLLNVKTCLEGGVHTVLVLRSESIPLVSLGRLFNIPGTLIDPASGLVVIVETGTRKIALLADDILGHQQFVIKSVEKNFRRIEGALGATILGDGTVALIIDVSALWDMHLECGGNPGASRGTGVLLAA
jgi:two-component system chemotaxis sensor kinase CheA